MGALAAALLVCSVLAAVNVGPSGRKAGGVGIRDGGERSPEEIPATSVYEGLGAWIDAYDYGPAYHRAYEGRLLAPEDLDLMADRGVRTLYLQATRLDPRSPHGLVDPAIVGRFLERAHQRGLWVVGWYLPKFADLEADLANLRLIRDFEHGGHRFDGIGVDIEWRRDVGDHAERSRRVLELSRRLRAEAAGLPLAAIVYPPVLLEAVYPGHWPGFPWRELAQAYDAWLPMAYWTETTPGSVYRQAYRYTAESIRALRDRLGLASVPVHAVGGVADTSTPQDVEGFVRAAREAEVVGLSLYDYRTTSQAGWEALHRAGAAP